MSGCRHTRCTRVRNYWARLQTYTLYYWRWKLKCQVAYIRTALEFENIGSGCMCTHKEVETNRSGCIHAHIPGGEN